MWLTLAEKYLTNKGVDWKKAERTCFNEWSNPDDDELGLQIVRVSHVKAKNCALYRKIHYCFANRHKLNKYLNKFWKIIQIYGFSMTLCHGWPCICSAFDWQHLYAVCTLHFQAISIGDTKILVWLKKQIGNFLKNRNKTFYHSFEQCAIVHT